MSSRYKWLDWKAIYKYSFKKENKMHKFKEFKVGLEVYSPEYGLGKVVSVNKNLEGIDVFFVDTGMAFYMSETMDTERWNISSLTIVPTGTDPGQIKKSKKIKIGDKFKSKNNLNSIYNPIEIKDIFVNTSGDKIYKVNSNRYFSEKYFLEDYTKIEEFRPHWKLMKDGTEVTKIFVEELYIKNNMFILLRGKGIEAMAHVPIQKISNSRTDFGILLPNGEYIKAIWVGEDNA